MVFQTHNIKNSETKIKKAIQLLASKIEDDSSTTYLNKIPLYDIVMQAGSKAYLTKQVAEDNKLKLFKPYKDLFARISDFIKECIPKYKYPRSLSTTIVETAYS